MKNIALIFIGICLLSFQQLSNNEDGSVTVIRSSKDLAEIDCSGGSEVKVAKYLSASILEVVISST